MAARALGVDLGSRRIGLAVSDASGTIARPLAILERGADHRDDHEAIMKVAHDEEADRIVVGWPRSLSGRDGPAARSVRDEVVELRSVAGATCSVELYDERFSTITATERLREARPTPRRDRSRRSPRAGGAGRRSRRTVEPVDAAAAAVILQSYLDIPTRPREAP